MSLRSRFQNWLNNAERRRDKRLARAKSKAERNEIKYDFQRMKTSALADLREQEARLARAEAEKRRAKRSEPRFSFMKRTRTIKQPPRPRPKKQQFKRDTRTQQDIKVVEGVKPFYRPKQQPRPEPKREKSAFEDW